MREEFTLRQRIRDALVEALNVDRDPEMPAATKRRWSPAQRDDQAHISVVFVDEPVVDRPGSLRMRALAIGVVCVNSAPYPEASDDLVEPMLAHVAERLGTRSALWDLVDALDEVTTRWEKAELERYYLMATNVWRLTYSTQQNDLSTFAA